VNFLNIGASELIVIIAIAILAIGPRRMVQIMRTLGRTAGKLRRMSSEFMGLVNSELRDTGLDPETVKGQLDGEATVIEGQVKTTSTEAKEAALSLKQEIGSLQAELQAAATEARAFVRRAAQAPDDDEDGAARPAAPSAVPAVAEDQTPAQGTAAQITAAQVTSAPAEPPPAPRVLGALGGLDTEGERASEEKPTQASVSVEEKAGEDEGTGAGERESEEEAAQPG